MENMTNPIYEYVQEQRRCLKEDILQTVRRSRYTDQAPQNPYWRTARITITGISPYTNYRLDVNWDMAGEGGRFG
jgi:hypothetical protein